MARKRRGRSAAFMRSINPHLRKRRHHSHGGSMARRHRKKRSYSHGSKSGFGNTIWATILGVAGFVLYEVFVRPLLANFIGGLGQPVMSVGEIALGLWLSKKGGWMGNVGKAAVVINAYNLTNTYVRPMFGM